MDFLLMISGLLFVVCLMIGLAWLIQKFGLDKGASFLNTKKAKSLEILEILPVDTKRRLLILRAGKKNYLVMTSPHGDVVIDKNIAIHKADS